MLICIGCVSCEISKIGYRIAVDLLSAWRTSCGDLHKLLDKLHVLTRTQSGEYTICLSLRFQYKMFQITSTIPTTCSSNLLKTTPSMCSHKCSFSNFRVYTYICICVDCIWFSRQFYWSPSHLQCTCTTAYIIDTGYL